ncbi:Fe2OG dioxygenase domain-containing protein [Haematococcus lacustris]|uniref:Fe2OG dioxygenase domain-containing protein n=1 Tax=Haematococcus lacustris TaxID=44745 RepID=A0A699ZUV7_HAELA|nr:Fe2OG dioxygenase domain-containing protein [Haematococcus lacustris]
MLHEDPSVARPGIRISAVAGRALIFWSALPDGTEDLASLHAAEKVVQGNKWIATRYFDTLMQPLV